MLQDLNSKLEYAKMTNIDIALANKFHKHVIILIPAVVDPSFANAGFSFASDFIFVSGRMPSSTEIITGFTSPVFGSTIYTKHSSVTKTKN